MSIQHQTAGKKVLIVSASVGAGHNQAAKAVMEALAARGAGLELAFVDAMQCVPGFFRAYYAGGFALAMSHFPRGYGFGFALSNHPNTPKRGISERVRLWWERACTKQLAQLVIARQPDLIVNTHFLMPPVSAQLKRAGKIASRQVTVVTDVEVHRWWYSEDVDHWFVPTDYSAEKFPQWGIARDRVTASGIPLRPKWTAPLPPREQILADWQLPADRPIVLLSGGTEFTAGPVLKIAWGIAQASPQACVVILCGRNKKLLAEASGLGLPDRIRPMGFTDRMPELAAVASLMVTKPGGITTAECLSKGLPMVFLRPVPGQEGGNAKYYQRQGAGMITTSGGATVEAVRGLLADPAALGRMAQAAKGLYRPGAELICDKILDIL